MSHQIKPVTDKWITVLCFQRNVDNDGTSSECPISTQSKKISHQWVINQTKLSEDYGAIETLVCTVEASLPIEGYILTGISDLIESGNTEFYQHVLFGGSDQSDTVQNSVLFICKPGVSYIYTTNNSAIIGLSLTVVFLFIILVLTYWVHVKVFMTILRDCVIKVSTWITHFGMTPVPKDPKPENPPVNLSVIT